MNHWIFVVELDHHVGRILRKLAELGIERNTLVIFTRDNGPLATAQILDDAFPVSFVLHDLDKDIEESTDVSPNHPQTVKEMHALLKEVVREGRRGE